MLDELIRLRVDVIVQASTPGAVAAKRATSTIPVVFVGVTDPVCLGLVASLGRPGGNMSGLALAIEGGLRGEMASPGRPTYLPLSGRAVIFRNNRS